LRELAASIAHEVNEPLAAIVADADANANACLNWLAAERPNLNNVREELAAIVSDGDRAGQVVTRIRALLLRSAEARRPCDLEDVIAGVLPLIGPAFARAGIVLETSLATDLPQVMDDPIEFQQVLIELHGRRIWNKGHDVRSMAHRRGLLGDARESRATALLAAVAAGARYRKVRSRNV
jgi:C4-dicarboxylate-specific signal transduction histidine kinase